MVSRRLPEVKIQQSILNLVGVESRPQAFGQFLQLPFVQD